MAGGSQYSQCLLPVFFPYRGDYLYRVWSTLGDEEVDCNGA